MVQLNKNITQAELEDFFSLLKLSKEMWYTILLVALTIKIYIL